MGTELNAKPHYLILDGLRGVAAILVVFFHLFEAHSSGHLDQVINHGYLAVDFFFVLSGFVVGYAYDDRWNKMTIGAFFKRRLIRLQPMVVMGMFIGAVFFFFGSDAMFPEIGRVSVWQVMLLFVIGSTLLPVPPSMDIRGWGGNASVERTCLVTFLRIYGQYSLCLGDPEVFEVFADLAGDRGWRCFDTLCRDKSERLSGRRMETGRSATEARVYPSDVSVFRRVVIIPDRFPDPDKICF